MIGPLPRLLAAATLARTADAGAAVVIVLAAVRVYGSPAPGSLALAAMLVPHVLAGPFVGLVTDRARRPRLVHAAFAAVFAAELGAALLALGRAPIGVVLVLALVTGCCGPMIFGGLSSRLDDVVPEPGRARARGLDAATYNVAEIAGPAVGAALVATLGVPWAAGALTAVCLAAAALLLSVGGRAGRRPQTRFTDDLRDGFRAIVVSRPLRAVTAATCVASFGLGILTPVAVLLGSRAGHAAGGGLLVTALGAGALAGSLLVARRPVRSAPHRVVLACLVAGGVVLAAVPFAEGWPLLVGLFAVAGFFDGPLLAAVLQVRSAEAPPHTRTQVFTLGAGLKLTAASLGAAVFTLFADAPVAALAAALAVSQLAAAALGALLLAPARAAQRMASPAGTRSGRPPETSGSRPL
ncbi:MFS transporter [Dactylosporangium fulvum]|uniref:MFS transporter n=1 Tax=Dactylosporangium fulvum TaxID=53359 RepID=UPI0031D33F98